MKRLGRLLDSVPYLALVIMALIAAAVPFDYPHLLEKSRMLLEGRLTKPIDIFDLFFHSLPLLLLAAKIVRDATRRKS